MLTRAPKKLCIGLSLATTWLGGNSWRRDDSRIEQIHDPAFYLSLAQRAEEARLDFVFRPDALFINPETLVDGPGFSSLDPTVLLSALALQTSRIGLVSTASTTFMPPYVIARQLQSLHHVSNGRAGWNIVTSLDGHLNFGAGAMPPADERYAMAAESAAVVRALWDSHPHEALRIERIAGRYADSSQVRTIDHVGQHFQVRGPLNLPSHPAGRPPLFQAGASASGRQFAASVADAVFAATPDISAGVELRQDLRARAARCGRSEDSVRVLPGLSLYLGHTRAEAQELYAATHAGLSMERRYQAIEHMLGLDLRAWPADHPLGVEMLPAQLPKPRSQTHADLLLRLVQHERPTVETLLSRPEVVGAAHWNVIGTVDDAVASIIERVEAGAADGLILLPGGALSSLELALKELVPRLAECGLFHREYSGATLREHLQMAGKDA
ncbi:NtaA/DmoA family FMN-dependent monooxygenase [Comamonas sp.]|uniref:NtaA/DmoA family FMN-dependent monooxygenase n=1 Tax=Comamonas sp. TaxID=34028 RepID=UPI00289D0149|nr:NtaA/DmoA family FMN-dependent monooxygenase [Comamonas sp.]